jgi:hypothetical protein
MDFGESFGVFAGRNGVGGNPSRLISRMNSGSWSLTVVSRDILAAPESFKSEIRI